MQQVQSVLSPAQQAKKAQLENDLNELVSKL